MNLSKADKKSQVARKVYDKSLVVRKLIDTYDKSGYNVMVLNETLCAARELVKFLEKLTFEFKDEELYAHNPQTTQTQQ